MTCTVTILSTRMTWSSFSYKIYIGTSNDDRRNTIMFSTRLPFWTVLLCWIQHIIPHINFVVEVFPFEQWIPCSRHIGWVKNPEPNEVLRRFPQNVFFVPIKVFGSGFSGQFFDSLDRPKKRDCRSPTFPLDDPSGYTMIFNEPHCNGRNVGQFSIDPFTCWFGLFRICIFYSLMIWLCFVIVYWLPRGFPTLRWSSMINCVLWFETIQIWTIWTTSWSVVYWVCSRK